MHGATLKCIVKVLAMRRRAIDEGSTGRTQTACMTDGRAWSIVVAAGQRTLDVVLVASGHAKTDHVDQQIFALSSQGLRQVIST